MLEKFKAYLLETAYIKDRYVPYYMKWVSECYAFLDEPIESILNSDQKQAFLRHLSRSHEDWQVRQADYALRLYNFFLSQKERAETRVSEGTDEAWRLVEERTVNALRLNSIVSGLAL
jgi:hypothetical protein